MNKDGGPLYAEIPCNECWIITIDTLPQKKMSIRLLATWVNVNYTSMKILNLKHILFVCMAMWCNHLWDKLALLTCHHCCRFRNLYMLLITRSLKFHAEKLIMERSGYLSVGGVRQFERTSDQQCVKVSKPTTMMASEQSHKWLHHIAVQTKRMCLRLMDLHGCIINTWLDGHFFCGSVSIFIIHH